MKFVIRSAFRSSIFLAFVAASALSLPAEDIAVLKSRLHTADVESSLNSPDLKPWHLLLSFQLLDAKEQPKETGTIEEWWAGPKLHKTIYTSPSYTNTELVNEQGLYKTAPNLYPPEMLALVYTQVVHPMPAPAEIDDAKPDLRKQDFGKVPLDCIMLSQPIKNVAYPPLGLFPTFCFDRDKTLLRATFNYGSLLITRNHMGLFQGKSVVLDQAISLNNVPTIKAHLDKLVGAQLTSADFLPAAEMAKIEEGPLTVPNGVMTGSVVTKINPIYPERAKANHVSGDVMLKALIGTDGRIHMLKLLSTPDPDLALASFAVVRQWTYKPYLLNGKPVSVDTTITTHFMFGP